MKTAKKYCIRWTDSRGVSRVTKFAALESAMAVAGEIFEETGKVVGIESLVLDKAV